MLAVQKVLPGSERAGRLRLMGEYIGYRLVARRELDNTFWTDSTYEKFYEPEKAVAVTFSLGSKNGGYIVNQSLDNATAGNPIKLA